MRVFRGNEVVWVSAVGTVILTIFSFSFLRRGMS